MILVSTSDVQARMTREMSPEERGVCDQLLRDAVEMIYTVAPHLAGPDKVCVYDRPTEGITEDDQQRRELSVGALVACRMVIRALGDGGAAAGAAPIGATQGSMSGLGYTQSWTMANGGSTGELYLSKTERQLLRRGNSIGSYSPVQGLAQEVL